MTGVDTNILIDLMVSSSQSHRSSVNAISQSEDDLCTTPTNIGECLRLLTHSKVFSNPLTLGRAVTVLDQMLDYYKLQILDESIDWWKELIKIEKEIPGIIPGIRGNEIFDARIALCLKSHGVKKIYTRDADFKKYSFLKLMDLSG
ncbi:PIN domain-containing protein [Candidatus Nomurabacteria bacterium]|nr:PIN domain-containing protein [Candidatus Nomurabacteria bacterium]